MDNLQTYRLVLHLTKRIDDLELQLKNGSGSSTVIDLSDVNRRLGEVEARPVVDLSDVNRRLGEVEKRPELTQRLSALELTVATLNS